MIKGTLSNDLQKMLGENRVSRLKVRGGSLQQRNEHDHHLGTRGGAILGGHILGGTPGPDRGDF